MNATTAPSSPAQGVGLDLDRVPWGAVVTYLAIALGLAWVVMLPLWLGGEGLASPLFLPLTAAMMFTPTIAALVATFFVLKPARRARFLGLTMPRVGRTILLILVWPVVFTVLGFAAFFLAAAVGWIEPDYTLTGLRGVLATQGMDVGTYLALSFGMMHLSMLIGTLTAFGEELGWRGFLVAATAPLGFWPGTLFRGVVWGLWHAPIILLGYNFQRPDLLGLLAMCAFTVAIGVFFDWARYWTKSMWASAFGHGALNAVVTSTLIFAPASGDVDPLFDTFLGIPGWVVCAAVIGLMVLVGAFRRSTLLPLIPLPKPRPAAQAAPGAAGYPVPGAVDSPVPAPLQASGAPVAPAPSPTADGPAAPVQDAQPTDASPRG